MKLEVTMKKRIEGKHFQTTQEKEKHEQNLRICGKHCRI